MRLPKQLKYSIIGLALSIASGASQAQTDHLAEAHRLLKQGQPAQALSRADAYVLARPQDPQGRFVRGLALAEMNRTQEAIAVFKKLTEDFPELPEPYNNLAVLYAQEKQFDKARQALEAALRTHPSYAVAHENLGDIYAKLASQAYGKALQIDAGNRSQSKLALLRDLNAKPTAKPSEAAKPNGEPGKLAAAQPGPRLAGPDTPLVVTPIAPPSASSKPASGTPATAVQQPTAKPAATAAPVVAAAPATATPADKPLTPPANAAPPAAVTPAATPPATTPPASTTPAATSAPTPAAPVAAASAGAESELRKTLADWAAAWARKDVKAYLAYYAPDFQPPNGQTRRAWETERSQRVGKPGKIEVSTTNVAVDVAADKASVRFRQHYKSANLSTSATKTLVFVRHSGRWLIQQERVN